MLNIRTGEPFRDDVNRRVHAHHHPSIDGECIEGWSGRARGLMGGAFMGAMLAQQGVSLPYDYEVEYITSNGNAYFDCAFELDNNTDLAFDIKWTSLGTYSPFCSRISSGNFKSYTMFADGNRTRLDISNGSAAFPYKDKSLTSSFQRLEVKSMVAKLDGVDITTYGNPANPLTGPTGANLRMWAANPLNYYFKGSMTSWTINGVKRLVMCVKDGQPAVYDAVLRSFAVKGGAGTFTAGPRVN